MRNAIMMTNHLSVKNARRYILIQSAGLVSKYLEGIDDKTIEKIDDQDGNKMINKTIVSLSTILSTYFFSTAEYTEERIEFLHKSFSEYLIAEYYIESILDERLYRLNIGIASSETISFLDDLLKLISLISKNEIKNNEFVEGFLNFLKKLLTIALC
jgi:hypothetical protein